MNRLTQHGNGRAQAVNWLMAIGTPEAGALRTTAVSIQAIV
jgi:hypothetical protein